MKLSTRQDIEVPLAQAFSAFADIEGWERAALRRGAEVTRINPPGGVGVGVGMGWLVDFTYRGKARKLSITLAALDAPDRIVATGTSKMIDGTLTLEFLELGARRTRVTIGTELKPNTLSARLFLKSLRLAKAKVNNAYEARVAGVCRAIENRHPVAPDVSPRSGQPRSGQPRARSDG